MTGGQVRATCPGCRYTSDIATFLQGPEQTALCMKIANLPGNLPALTWRYLDLFRNGKNAVQIHKATAIVSELADILRAGQFSHERRTFRTTPAALAEAMMACQENLTRGTLTPPLRDNGYLLPILVSKTNATNADGENAREERLRVGGRGTRTTNAPPARQAPDAIELFNRQMEEFGRQDLTQSPTRHKTA